MLSTEVTANLDYLASLGVLDYDAASHIAGSKPRYYGSPNYYVPPVVMTPMDTFTPSNASSYNPFSPAGVTSSGFPSFKTIGKWVLGLGALYLGGKAFLGIGKGIKGFSLTKMFSKGKKAASNAAAGVQSGIRNAANNMGIGKKPWYKRLGNTFSGIFKKKSRIRL